MVILVNTRTNQMKKIIPDQLYSPKFVHKANGYRVAETKNGEHKQYFFGKLEQAQAKYQELTA